MSEAYLLFWVFTYRPRQPGLSAISWAHEKLLIFHGKNNYFHNPNRYRSMHSTRKICVIVNAKCHENNYFLHEISVIFIC